MSKGRWFILGVGAIVLGGVVWAVFANFGYRSPVAVPPTSDPPWFKDVTEEVGLDFVHDAGPVGDYFMPQQVGSGAAFFDFDNDGLLDILLLQNGGPKSASINRLYRQHPRGKFQDVSSGSGLDINGYNMGVAIGDANNDGWSDVLITQYSGVRLFLNVKGKFQDATEKSGLDNPSWGSSAAFFDYDRDGWLDLILVCYVDYDPTWPCKGPSGLPDYCAPKTFKGRVSRLFHNLGQSEEHEDAPRFEDVTIPSGLGTVPGPGLGVLCADFDGDGWTDIFISNDGEANRLWINQRNGAFTEEAVLRGVAYNMQGQAQAGMGIAYGDVDADGLGDIFVSHLAQETHALWKQGPRGIFTDRTSQSGILQSHWRGTGFGTLFGDFTNAGHVDIALANGSVFAQSEPGDPALGPFWSKYGQRNQLFAGGGNGVFRDVSLANPDFCGRDNVARGLVRGDFDGDGGLDLLVTTIAGRARLFRNVAPDRGHWLSLRAFDPELKRDALGTSIRIEAGSRRWQLWLHPAESYLCSSEPVAHVGLGAAEQVDRIEVTWPNGDREEFAGGEVDQRRELRKGMGSKVMP
jgi:hypothetical protein